MDPIQNRMQQQSCGSNDFVLIIWTSKLRHALSGRPIVENVDKIIEIVESDGHASTYSIAQELKISQKIVWNHLYKAGLKKKLAYGCHTNCRKRNFWTESMGMVTGDEKWVTYENNRQKRSWSKRGEPAQTIAKPGLTAKKVLLCLWWDWKGIIHYELFPSGHSLKLS